MESAKIKDSNKTFCMILKQYRASIENRLNTNSPNFPYFQMRDSDQLGSVPTPPPLFDLAQTTNTSRTLLDHVSVSVEAQAIIGGVVGFWGGVFGMGLVYLLVVFLRRFRKNWADQRNQSIPSSNRSLLDKAGYSAMFGQARNNASIDLMDIPTSAAHQSSLTTVPESTASSSVPTTASHRMPRTKPFHKTSSHAFGLGSSTSSSIGGHGGGFGGSGGGTRLKFSGFGLGSMRDDGGGMADCQL